MLWEHVYIVYLKSSMLDEIDVRLPDVIVVVYGVEGGVSAEQEKHVFIMQTQEGKGYCKNI